MPLEYEGKERTQPQKEKLALQKEALSQIQMAQQRLVTVGCSGPENLTPAFI